MDLNPVTFWQSVSASLIGTVTGFLLSLALFYLTEQLKRNRDTSKILKGLRRELKFNLALHDSWLNAIDDCRLKVASGDTNVFTYLDYTRFLTIFIVQAVRDGILYDRLNDDELVGLDKAIRAYSPQTEQFFTKQLDAWKANQISNADMSKTLDLHRYIVTTNKTAVLAVLTKIAES